MQNEPTVLTTLEAWKTGRETLKHFLAGAIMHGRAEAGDYGITQIVRGDAAASALARTVAHRPEAGSWTLDEVRQNLPAEVCRETEWLFNLTWML